MSENSSSGNNSAMNTLEDDLISKSETRVITQQDVNEHIRIYIAHLIRQLENLTRLIQGTSAAQQAKFTQMQGTSANFIAVGCSLDT